MVSAESAFVRRIKMFQLTDLLVQIGELSRFLFHKDSSILEVPFTQIVGPYQRRGSITVTAWWLVDIAYLAIENTNDFARSVPSRQDLMQICSEFIRYDDQRTEITLGPTPTMVDLMTYLFGVAEKTFWYQDLYKTKGKFNRDVELLETIPESLGSVINVNDIILRSTGFTAKQFRKLLLALFAVSLKQVDLTVVTANGTAVRWDPILTQENLQSVIEMYSAQYSEYRNSILNENYFIVKPIVKTLRNRYVSVSPFLLSRKMYDGVFWKVRDFYNATERDKQLFTNEFGKLFETYVQNLLGHYLDPAQYRRIDQSSEKGADWIVSSSNHTILVEQKSTVMSLLLRTPYIDNEDLNCYVERLVEAVEQLDRSESRYCEDHGSNPKLILLYDERLMSENMLRERIVSLATDRIENLENYFLISIGDFEHLIQILSENPSAFENIMDYKIRVAQSQPREGQEFYQIIPRFYNKGNMYIEIPHWAQGTPKRRVIGRELDVNSVRRRRSHVCMPKRIRER